MGKALSLGREAPSEVLAPLFGVAATPSEVWSAPSLVPSVVLWLEAGWTRSQEASVVVGGFVVDS